MAIHDLNQHGGQDRSTLEIFLRLAKRLPLSIHAFTVSDPALASVAELVRPNLARPVLAKALYFYARLLLRELAGTLRGDASSWVWHATGVSHVRSRVVHLQFLHKAWRARRDVPEPGGWLRRAYRDLFERFNVLLEERCFREGKTYIAISEAVARDLREHFGIRGGIHVVRHGVDPARFRPLSREEKLASPVRKRLGIGAGEGMALFVGSYERKGLDAILGAWSLLAPELRGRVRLVAVGDGDREHFAAVARELGVSDRILLVPKEKEIVPYFQAADAFVFPTRYEPFGLVILEALACGLPTVVSRAAGGSELIRDGESGLLLDDPTDRQELAGRIAELFGDPGRLEGMSRAARGVAEARSWDRVAEEYAGVLEPLLRQ